MQRKLCLCVVDAMRTDMLEAAAAAGRAPNFANLLRRGGLVRDCVSAFPSVTPVASSEIVTGTRGDQHWIPGMNWYHRAEQRYVEYGSSFEATRTFGLFRALYDTVYNMNMAHLSHDVETVFERLGDHGVRTACTPFLIYRGRTRHEVGLEGVLKRAVSTVRFDHAVWGPDELFYGELYASRRVPCKPTLARPGTRDEYSACVSERLAADDLYDFLLFSLPDNDHHSHHRGPESSVDSIAHADTCFGRLVDAWGGTEAFLDSHAVILLADHAQTPVTDALPIAEMLGADWVVQQPNDERPEDAELAVAPTSRAAAIYALSDGRRRERTLKTIRRRLRDTVGVELVAHLADNDGPEAVIESAFGELHFRPGSGTDDLRGVRWDLEGERKVLDLVEGDGVLISREYPDAMARLWAALSSPYAGDLLVSCTPGYECVDWGGQTHLGGGSHGALNAADSLAPLLGVGLDDFDPASREQWSLTDVADLILGHFGADGVASHGAESSFGGAR